MNMNMLKAKKGFSIQELFGVTMMIIVLGIALVYGITVQEDVKADISDNTSVAYTAATDSINATAKISSKMGLIVTVVVAAVIIGILVRYLWIRFGSQ